jgi:hypothetical protein
VERLNENDEWPWATIGRNESALTANGLARRLRPFGIRPRGTLRFGAATAKGYERASFEDAWERYLSDELEVRSDVPDVLDVFSPPFRGDD